MKYEDAMGVPVWESGEGGVYIWLDGDGLWHLWGCADRSGHTFSGHVDVMGDGEIVGLLGHLLGDNDVLEMREGGVYFEFRVNGVGRDGMSFSVDGGEGLKFRLFDNGVPIDPLFVFVGVERYQPEGFEFEVECCESGGPGEDPPVVIDEPHFMLEIEDERIELRGCLLKVRASDDVGAVIWIDGDQRVEVHLKSYAIIPIEYYGLLLGKFEGGQGNEGN
jgi:hypothetical protein